MGDYNKTLDAIQNLASMALEYDNLYFDYTKAIAIVFPEYLKESFIQILNGPVSDGNLISKKERDIIINIGLATRVCVNGDQGFTGAKYMAKTVYDFICEIDK